MGNAVVHFEIGGADGVSLASFYGELFGWRPETLADGYWTVDTQGDVGIGGGISRSGRPSATFYVETEDPASTLARANELGGSTVMPVTDLGRGGTRAIFADPDGLLVGLVGGGQPHSPVPSAGSGAPVTWFEILGADAARTRRFYVELFGWKLDHPAHPDYAVVDTGAGRGIWGGVGGGVESRWAIVYVGVADVDQTLSMAEKLGGSCVSAPGAAALKNAARAALYGSAEDMSIGWIRDPAGSVVGLAHKATR
jgi:uncharacterized protein